MSTLSLRAPALRIRKRTVAVVLSVILAAAATGALVTYVRGIESKAVGNAVDVPAFVAKVNIPANTSAEAAIAAGAFRTTMVPRRLLLAGAVSTLAALQGKVSAVAILEGEQIVASRFVLPSEVSSILSIPSGSQAFSVQTDSPAAVGGFIQPGDRVSIVAKVDVVSGTTTTATTRYLVQNVPVLAIGQTVAAAVNGAPAKAADSGSTRAQPAATQGAVLLTLALKPSDVEKVTFAVLQGQIYFTLVPKGQAAAVTKGRTQATVFN